MENIENINNKINNKNDNLIFCQNIVSEILSGFTLKSTINNYSEEKIEENTLSLEAMFN